MSWIKQLNEQELTEKDHTILPEMNTFWDKIGNILKVQSLKPETMLQHARFYRSLMFGKSKLSRSQKEMIAVVVSAANFCEY